MQTRKLGSTNLEVPPIMLGANVYGWTLGEAESLRQLDSAHDAGLTFIDTADVYSRWVPGHTGGESERIIGKWLAASGKRAKVVVATKVGMDMGEGRQGLNPAYIEEAVEASLRRLQTDYIDLYQSHRDDETVPLEDTLGAYQKLIDQGKVRYIGASNYTGARLREAMETSARTGLVAYSTLQPHYNLVERAGYESDLAPVVAEYGLAVVPYFSLAAGFLTGKYRTPGRRGAQAARHRCRKVPQRARAACYRCAGRRGRSPQFQYGRGRSGLVTRQAGDYADSQCHQRRTVERTGRGRNAHAGRRRNRPAEPGQ